MKIKQQWLSILIVAMSLATAWAIRGQFGHEQGAAWAGAIGGLALVMVSRRKDWYNKMVLVALASAIGWGVGGMISYGRVVGYGRADNFINAFYGLGMLFVIGALFGLLGGGLVGLTLDSTKENKVKWGRLVAEMTAGGIISYFFLIEQIGFKMTPPRSEAWAVCLGMGVAMIWHMARENRNSAIRVAISSALGGGFGFGFGNFLQVLGNVLEINFNMWNVMEYSIGFFGGTGMAYGVFSSKWPEEAAPSKKWINRAALFIIAVFIPLIVYRESLSFQRYLRRLGEIPNLETVALISTIFSFVIILSVIILSYWIIRKNDFKKNVVISLFLIFLVAYTLQSYSVTGIFAGRAGLNHHLYVANIVVIFFLVRKSYPALFENPSDKVTVSRWFIYFIVIVAVLALLSLIAINIHGEMGGAHNRFPLNNVN